MLSSSQVTLLFTFVEVLCQTVVYGSFIVVVPIAAHSLRKKGISRRPNVVMFAITLFIFLLSTAYWAVTVGTMVSSITQSGRFKNPDIRELFNAIVLVSYVFADGVVVWRMSVLCKDQFPKAVLVVPPVILALTALSVAATIGVRVAVTASPGGMVPRNSHLARALDILQIINLVLSLLTNITATSVINLWAWRYRQSIDNNLRKRSSSEQISRIMILVAESGVIYCISSIIVLAGSFIRVPGGTLGDVYTGIHAHIAGMYPALVMILINNQQSSEVLVSAPTLDINAGIGHDKTVPIGSLRFANAASGKTGNATNVVSHTGPHAQTVLVAMDNQGDDSYGTVSSGDTPADRLPSHGRQELKDDGEKLTLHLGDRL